MGDAEEPRPKRYQFRIVGHSVLGFRYRRIHSDAGIHRRVVRTMVSVRGFLVSVSHSRAQLLSASAMGMEHWRSGSAGDSELFDRSERTSQSRSRADLQKVSRAALSHAAVHILGRARMSRYGFADDA